MQLPGALDELDRPGLLAWEATVTDAIKSAIEDFDAPYLLVAPDGATKFTTIVDWVGLPSRVVECATRAAALQLLDDVPSDRTLQEEYLEWRAVHDRGRMRRLDLTTELREYWRVLAAYQPEVTLDLVADFADEGVSVSISDVYGDCDPFDGAVEPTDRAAAFTATMLPPDGRSAYNDGRLGICCLTGATNTVKALGRMVAAATNAKLTRDEDTGRDRLLTCAEAIPLMQNTAQAGRASDPVLVERLMRLAFEQRLIALADPPGIYIQSVQHTRLVTPDGEQVPASWFTFSRGTPAEEHADGLPRWQRLELEVPVDTGWTINDLTDVATEQPIRSGGQIAELVQVAAILAVSDPGLVSDNDPGIVDEPVVEEIDCRDVQSVLQRDGTSPSRRDARDERQ